MDRARLARLTLVALLLVATAAAGVRVWAQSAERAAATVVSAGHDVTCANGHVERVDIGRDGFPLRPDARLVERVTDTPQVTMRTGLDCTLTFEVHNTGDVDVRLTRLWLPFFGPASRMGQQATGLHGLGDARFVPTEVMAGGFELERVDAVWDIDHPLPARASRTVEVPFGLNDQACLGGTTSTTGLVKLTVEARHRSVPVNAGGAISFVGTEDTVC